MKHQIVYTQYYNQKAVKFFKKNPHLVGAYQKTLELLELNPQHPSLRLHKLQGKLKELYSISINMSYRIILDFIIHEKKIILLNIGDHADVYRQK